MAILFTKEDIEYSERQRRLLEIRDEASKLCEVVESYLEGKTTRSQLNKALKKVKYLMEESK